MKKILLLSACLCVAGLAQAQAPSFGIKAGLNAAKFAGDPDPQSEFLIGFSAGLFTNIPISTGFSFEPSVEYAQKGAEWTSGATEMKSKISYIDVPLMAKFALTPAFSVFGGPQVSFFVDQESKLVTGSGNTTTWEGNNDSYRKSLAGGKAGVSYSFGNVAVNASYATDFQNLYNEDATSADLKNQAINLGLAFRLR